MFKFPYCPPQNVLHRKKLVKAHRSYVLVENYNWENRLKKMEIIQSITYCLEVKSGLIGPKALVHLMVL